MISKIKRIWRETDLTMNFVWLVSIFTLLGILMLLSSSVLGLLTQSLLEMNQESIIPALFIFITLEVLVLTINYRKERYQTMTVQLMKRRIKNKTVSSLIHAPFAFSKTQEQGDILGRLNNDVNSTVSANTMAVNMVKSTILLVILSIGMILMEYRLFILFLIPMVLLTGIQLISSMFTMKLVMPWKIAMGETHSLAQDIINNRGTIRIFQIYKQVHNWVQEALNNSKNKGLKGIFLLYVMQVPLLLLISLPMINVLIGGTYLVSQGNLSLASLVSALTISQLAIDEFNPIINGLMNVPHQMTSAERLFPIWDAGLESFGTKTSDLSPLIEMKELTFSYDGDKQILENINMTIHQGEFVGFVGESGSGKSTLLNIINGLYQPTQGSINLKGLSIDEWDKGKFRNHFGVVSQNAYLLNDTVENNLLLGDVYSKDELIKVLEDVSLDKPLDLVVGEKGSLLSGGERQRLSIARAILRHPEILLFDEATSALDLKTEHVVNTYLETQSSKQTRIVVAHRLSSVIHCDTIYAFRKGRIVEQGSHLELMNLKRYYYQLVTQQNVKEEQANDTK